MLKLARVDELDGLRGFLALWVAVSHIICLSGGAAVTLPLHFQSAWSDFVFAQPAVETFIILSGFAISFLLHAKPQAYSEFMIGRFFRIVPTYFVCLVLGAFVAMKFTPWLIDHATWRSSEYFVKDVVPGLSSEHQHLKAHFFWHALLLHGLFPRQFLFGSGTALLPPAWSISLEWQYYLVAPLIARVVRSNLGVIILVLVALFAAKLGNAWNNPLPAFLPIRLDLFLVGIGSYHLYAWSREAGRAPSPIWIRFVAASFSVALLGSLHSVALQIWVIVFGASFVAGKSLLVRWVAGPRRLLLQRWPQLLGKWSYPLYLLHWPLVVLLLCLLVHVFPAISSRSAVVVMLLGGLPLIVAGAALLHYFVEKPSMRWGRQFSHRKAVARTHPEP